MLLHERLYHGAFAERTNDVIWDACRREQGPLPGTSSDVPPSGAAEANP